MLQSFHVLIYHQSTSCCLYYEFLTAAIYCVMKKQKYASEMRNKKFSIFFVTWGSFQNIVRPIDEKHRMTSKKCTRQTIHLFHFCFSIFSRPFFIICFYNGELQEQQLIKIPKTINRSGGGGSSSKEKSNRVSILYIIHPHLVFSKRNPYSSIICFFIVAVAVVSVCHSFR